MRSFGYLENTFKEKAEELISQCAIGNVRMVPFVTLRTPIQQAKYWRQSRSWTEIKAAIDMFKSEDAEWLAEILENVGPQYGRKITSALPGLSWHQWGKAMDCFSLINAKANWDSGHDDYDVYAKKATELGLTAGHYWKSRDSVHVQNRSKRVRECYSLKEVSKIMADKYNRRLL